jgi:predicted RNase H-like HicB family nuclease
VKIYQEFEINYFQVEDGMFTAEVPAIRGCVAWAKTLQECSRNAVEGIDSCLEARLGRQAALAAFAAAS